MRKYTKETEIGKIYGYLKILDFTAHEMINGKPNKAIAFVKCLNCESDPKNVLHVHLTSTKGKTISCGCIGIQTGLKHNLWHHPYYLNCAGAIKRCYPSNKDRHNYYDRGIKCYWSMESIANFIKYLEDNLPPKLPNQSLDRIDNSRGYEPGNIRWATAKEQSANRRRIIKKFEYDQLKFQFTELQNKYDCLKKKYDDLVRNKQGEVDNKCLHDPKLITNF